MALAFFVSAIVRRTHSKIIAARIYLTGYNLFGLKGESIVAAHIGLTFPKSSYTGAESYDDDEGERKYCSSLWWV